MALLTTQTITRAGLTLVTAAASAGGDTVRCDSRVLLLVENTGASSCTVTIPVPGTTNYGASHPSLTVTVAAGAKAMIGPIDSEFATPGTSPATAAVTYNQVSGVLVAAALL